jgi:hypothetical protein
MDFFSLLSQFPKFFFKNAIRKSRKELLIEIRYEMIIMEKGTVNKITNVITTKNIKKLFCFLYQQNYD